MALLIKLSGKTITPLLLLLLLSPGPRGGGEGIAHLLCKGKRKGEETTLLLTSHMAMAPAV